MRNELHLTNPQIKQLRQPGELLHGRELIAKGGSSLVFEGDSPDQILKITVDIMAYEYLTCNIHGVGFSQGYTNLPKVLHNYGFQGETTIRRNRNNTAVVVPLWAYTMPRYGKLPRLSKLRPEERNLLTAYKTIVGDIKAATQVSFSRKKLHWSVTVTDECNTALAKTEEWVQEGKITEGQGEELEALFTMALNYEARLDAPVNRNLAIDDKGYVILLDPVFDFGMKYPDF